jgi:hypothetical protein
MRCATRLAGIILGATMVVGGAQSEAKTAPSAQMKTCSDQAKQQGLKGAEEKSFLQTCLKGALAPSGATLPPPKGSAKAVVAPAGAAPTLRSKQCNAEAARRGLHDAAFQSFRESCVASAAPVGAIETQLAATKPTHAIKGIESATNKPPEMTRPPQ